MIVLSDLHIGANRSAGTTPASAKALRGHLLSSFKGLLDKANEDVILNGDIFDSSNISMTDLLETYNIILNWLTKGYNLTVVVGNHDLYTDTNKLSSLQFMAELLVKEPNVTYISGGMRLNDEIYIISHVRNQDLLDLELSKVPACKYLLLHCNYDNPFSKHLDNSLDLSEQQAKDCKAEYIVLGHEHHTRKALGGKVFIPGNQITSSIADCVGGHDKYMTRLGDKPELVKVWDSATAYAELNWKDPQPTDARFIRFVGHATPDEAAQVADTIAKYRRASEAFIVGNAVKIGEDSEMEEFSVQSLEQARAFDVMGALKGFLTEEEYKILEKLND